MSQHQRQPRQQEHYEQTGQQRGHQSGQRGGRQPPQQMGGGQSQMGQQQSPQQVGQQPPQQTGQQQPMERQPQMGQQQPPQQMGGGGQPQMGQQQPPQQMGQEQRFETRGHQQPTGQQFSQSMPQPVVTAVEHLDRLETVAEFADGRATQQGNIEAARIADAIKDVAHLQKEFIVEENPLAQEFGQCCQQVIETSMQRLQPHQQQPEIQELTETCQQTIQSISSGLQAMPAGGQQGFGSRQR